MERQKRGSPRVPLEEVSERIDFLLAVGLGYLSLDRSAATLSGGEAQRIRLATQNRFRGCAASFMSLTSRASDSTPVIMLACLARSNISAISATPF